MCKIVINKKGDLRLKVGDLVDKLSPEEINLLEGLNPEETIFILASKGLVV